MARNTGRWISTLLFLTVTAVSAHAQRYRAVWVTRWDYRTPGDVQQIMANLAALKANLVLFQVRGNGTVFYPSKIEPWAEELGGADPGWNPLETAIREAHSHGLKLFAWLNVYPGWRGSQRPANPQQLFNRHPEWFLADEDGNPLPLNSHYVWLNPVLPAVQDYLFSVVRELAATPGLDGLHFDYFRFPGPGVSYDSTSTALFRRHYGISVWDSTALWDRFRREAVTAWLRRTYRSIKHRRPGLVFSAAVIGDYDNGPDIFFQESHRWLAEGIMDMVFLMTYTDDPALLRRWLKRQKPFSYGRAVCPGLMVYSDTATVLTELRLVKSMRFPGLALFAYSSLFPDHRPGELAARLSAAFSNGGYPEATAAPESAGFFKLVQTIPSTPRQGDSLRVAARLGGTSAPPESLRCVAVWQGDGLFPLPRILSLKPAASNPSVWYSPNLFSLPQPGDGLFLQLFLFRPGKVRQTAVRSEPLQVIVDVSRDVYVQKNGKFGPLMTGVTRAAVDARNRLWYWEPGKGMHILRPNGAEEPESPLQEFRQDTAHFRPLRNLLALDTDSQGRILIACRENGGTLLLRQSPAGTGLSPFGFIPQAALTAAFDSALRVYLLRRDGWTVADARGTILYRFSFKNRHTPNNIAVSPGGKTVLVSCRTEGAVHRWERITEHPLLYLREDDVPTANVGLGEVSWSPSGTVTISHVPGHYVTVLDSALHLIDFVRGGKPALRAPRLAVCGPADSLLYILQIGGTTPVRVQKWQRVRFP